MIAQFGKRTIAFLLAMVMVFTLAPVPAFADETGEHDHDSEIAADSTTPSTEAPVAVIHEHDYVSTVTAQATCVEKGAVTYTCACGDSYVEETDPTGHSYVTEVVDATPEAQGYTVYTCVCGDSYQSDFVDYVPEEEKHEHAHVAGEVVAATPEAQGYTVYTCECGDSYQSDFVDYVPEEEKHEHAFVAGEVVAATPEAQGYTVYTCSCGETKQDDFTDYVPVEEEETESELLQTLRADIAAFVKKYWLEPGMTDGELANVWFYLNGEQAYNCWTEMEDLLARSNGLIAEEGEILLAEENTQVAQRFYNIVVKINTPSMTAGGTYTPADGVSVVVSDDSTTTTSESNGVITVTATPTGCSGTVTATITITNTTDATAVVSFNWSVSGSGAAFNGPTSPAKISLDAGASQAYTLTSGSGKSNPGTLTLSNFAVEAAADAYDVTFDFDAAFGSITVGGASVNPGDVVSVPQAGAELVATVNGSTFLGWVDAKDGKLLSTAATYTLVPVEAMNVTAAFATPSSAAWFKVDNAYLFTDLNAAAAAGTKIVLAADGVLAAGTYTIPSGDTLLIPFDEAGTLYTTAPASVDNSYTQPTVFRTLVMAEGANIVLNGAMSLSAKHNAANGGWRSSGSPVGPVPFVEMESNSNITINSGGALYAYGFITGSGSVVANSGATIYENFQFEDFRGGSQSTSMKNRVFALSQYYVQNIEVPLTIYSGAKEHSYTSIYFGTLKKAIASSVGFIGDTGSMFNITSGYVTKRYDGTTDRLVLETHGNVSLAGISMKVGFGSINSKDYELPINSNITLTVCDGSNISIAQGIVFMPGSEIVIEEGATCGLNSGYNAFVFDADQWGPYTFSDGTNYTMLPLQYAPSRTYTRTAADLKDVKIQVDGTMTATGGLITTASGANICSSGTGKITVNHTGTLPTLYQYKQAGDAYDAIPVTFAQLKNADNSYTQTAGLMGTFNYVDGKWTIDCDHNWTAATCTTPKTCGICGTTEGAALGHTWVDATCTAAKTCSACKATEGEALGHVSSGAPTCTADETCTRCGIVINAKLGHDESGAEATCTTAKTCVRCGAELVAALGHATYNAEVVAPTCDTDGYTRYTCSRGCGDYRDDDIVPAVGHKWGTVTYKRSDDNTTWTASRTCRSGETLEHTEQETVAVNKTEVVAACTTVGRVTYEADFTVDWAVDQEETIVGAKDENKHINTEVSKGYAATCTVDGMSDGLECLDCQKTVVAQTRTPALGHAWGETEYNWNADKTTCTATRVCANADHPETADATVTAEVTQEANCQQILITKYTFSFDVDWATAEPTVINGETDPTKHPEGSIADFAAVDPTCTTPGKEAGKKCTACGTVVDGGADTEAALGHAEVIDAAVAPTCTATGLTEGKHCERCGETLTAQETVAALGHNEVIDAAVAATCTETGLTEGKHCDRCGETLSAQTVVAALGHAEVTDAAVAATCTATGLTEGKHCGRCNTVIVAQTVTDALGHSEVTDEAVAPTCTETGLTEGKHCDRCNVVLKEQETVAALNHIEVTDAAVAPTCTETGLTEGRHCDRCGEILAAQETVDALGHAEIAHEGKDATCTEAGYKAYVTCSRCDYTTYEAIAATGHDKVTHAYKEPTCTEDGWHAYETCNNCDYSTLETIAALGHVEVTDAAVAPTCTTTGLTEGKHCSRCKEVLIPQEEVDALPHTEVIDEAVAPTCTETGLTEGKHCAVCKTVLLAQEVLEALPHSMDDGVVTKEPTCTATGVMTYTCKDCPENYTVTIPALGHKEVSLEAVAPTCTETGLTEGKQCSVCGAVTVAQQTVAAKGHTPGEPVKENEVDGTCTVGATYEEVVYCSVCKVEQSRKQITLTAPGHTEETVAGKEATCTATGLTEGKKCSVCGETTVAQKEIPVVPHNYDEGVVTTEPTCTEEGVKTFTCADCGATKTEAIAALKHDLSAVAAKAPTCTEGGYTTHKICSRCGYKEGYSELAALGHDSNKILPAVDPTCTETGLTAGKACSRCGAVQVAQETVPATDHTPSDTQIEEIDRVEATCTEDGSYVKVVYCDACGDEVERVTVTLPALGHEKIAHEAQEATCTEIGWDAYETCSRCDYTTYKENAALDHDIVNHEAQEATCTEDGWKEYVTCSRCDYTTFESIKAAGHSYVDHAAQAPTCTEEGWFAYKTCENCDYTSYTTSTYRKPLGHALSNVAAKEPTCTEIGWEAYEKCTRYGCDYTTYKEIAALNHNIVNHEAKEATCTEIGWDAYETCSRCDYTTYQEVAATGHTPEVMEAVAATCTATGLTEGSKCSVCGEVLTAQKETPMLDHTYVDGACTACGAKDPDAVTDVTVTPATGSTAIDFAVEGQVVTVTHSIPCKVGYLVDGAYVAVKAVANADGSYSFTVPEGVTEVALVVKGDVNGDGKVNNTDKTRLNAYLLGKNVVLNEANLFASDATGDGKLNNTDKTRMNAVLLNKTTLAW